MDHSVAAAFATNGISQEGVMGLGRSTPPCQISPSSVQPEGYRTPKLKFLLRFTKIRNIDAPQGRIPCAIFTKFAKFVARFRMCQLLKFGCILLKRLRSDGGLTMRESGFPHIFSAL